MEICDKHNKVRVQALRAWLELQGLSYQDLARKLGVSNQFISQLLVGNKKMPAARRAQLLDMGLPDHLLPDQACERHGQGCKLARTADL